MRCDMKKHLLCLVALLSIASFVNAKGFGGGLSGGLSPLKPKPLKPSFNYENGSKKSDKGQLAISISYAGVLATSERYVSGGYSYYGSSGGYYKTETVYGNLFDLGLRYTFKNKINLFLNGGVGAYGSLMFYGGVGYKLLRTEKFDASLGVGFGGYVLNKKRSIDRYGYSSGGSKTDVADFVFAGNINLMVKPVDMLGIFAEFDIGGGIFEGFMMMPRVGVSLLL